jgi:hypothetical protein
MEIAVQLSFALVACAVYLQTLAPSVIEIDSGELAAVQYTGGVAHPTGYPLFSALGYVYAKLPLFSSKILQLNVLAALYCVVGLLCFQRGALLVLESTRARQAARRKGSKTAAQEEGDSIGSQWLVDLGVAGVASLFLAFSRIVWEQSVATEVYSLQFFLLNLALWLTLRAWLRPSSEALPWALAAGSLALCFGNHLTSVMLLPGFALLFGLDALGSQRRSLLKRALIMAGVFVPLVALIYAWLPLRAAADPILNWGDPVDFGSFWRHVTGRQYQAWMFESAAASGENFRNFFRQLPANLSIAGLLLMLVGAVHSAAKSTRLFAFLLVSFAFNVAYVVHYNIKDLDAYFLLAYIAAGYWILLGIDFLLTRASSRRWHRLAALSVAGLLSLTGAWLSFDEVDRSETHLFEDYTKAALGSLPRDAIVLSSQWDALVSPAYYFQFVEGYRRDVAVIDKELLRRSWYYAQLSNAWPEVMSPVSAEAQRFLRDVRPFERGEAYDADVIERSFQAVIRGIVQKNLPERPVYFGPELLSGPSPLASGMDVVPEHFFWRVVPEGRYAPLPEHEFDIRYPVRDDAYAEAIRRLTTRMKIQRAFYELSFQQLDEARAIVAQLRREQPNLRLPEKLRDL